MKRRWMAGLMALALCLTGGSLALAEPLPARDMIYRTPNEDSEVLCEHDFCFWQLTEGELDETLVWQAPTSQ